MKCIGIPGISKVMSLKRYKKLTEYVRVADNTWPDQTNSDRDRHLKVRSLINMANTNFLRRFLPGRDISIHESMVAFKGRNFMRQYMPMKPIK